MRVYTTLQLPAQRQHNILGFVPHNARLLTTIQARGQITMNKATFDLMTRLLGLNNCVSRFNWRMKAHH